MITETRPLRIDDFEVKQVAFEVRYANAYLLWDHAGALWAEAARIWPDLEIREAKPGVTIFSRPGKNDISVRLDKANFTFLRPKRNLDEFRANAATLIQLVCRQLEITDLSRIGFRIFYEKTYPDLHAASRAILDTVSIPAPPGKHFGIEGKYNSPEYTLRLEGKSTGMRFNMAARTGRLDFDAPWEIDELESIHKEFHQVAFDIDYYTLAPVSIGQLNIQEWINNAYHVIKRDAHAFWGE
jgi:hypothetical protein